MINISKFLEKITNKEKNKKIVEKVLKKIEQEKESKTISIEETLRNIAKSYFVSEADLVTSFCLSFRELYGDSWIFYVEIYKENLTIDLHIKRRNPTPKDKEYYFEFKLSRGAFSAIDASSNHLLNSLGTQCDEYHIIQDLSRLRKILLAQKNDLAEYYSIVLIDNKKSFNFDFKNPNRSILKYISDYDLMAQSRIDEMTCSDLQKKILEEAIRLKVEAIPCGKIEKVDLGIFKSSEKIREGSKNSYISNHMFAYIFKVNK